jgi:hypothetical protein
VDGPGRKRLQEDENYWLKGDCRVEEEEEICYLNIKLKLTETNFSVFISLYL